MGKFVKKPVIIEAFRYGIDEAPEWFVDKVTTNDIECFVGENDETHGSTYCLINTLEGQMSGYWGDYIIQGVQGEVYPCKPSIFSMTYEEVLVETES